MKNELIRKILVASLAASARALLPLSQSFNISSSIDETEDALTTESTSGNTDCAASSLNTEFLLSFVSYGNYTALPEQGDDGLVPRQIVSMSFVVANAANDVYTICAFPLGRLTKPGNDSDTPAQWIDDASWQACADRKDTDGTHRFTIATGAAFGLQSRQLSVNQTWFCHDDDGRLVAYTGIANSTLDMTCADGGELGGYHVENCTSVDVSLPVTLL
ncbi:hypothetical protein F5B19DRAFT_435874 [Rostrohypoxylon terebratum]|nr:hypothetical protein F5B19DRAFT_435874 [Rostrohypoxylon terebratum]